MLTAGGWGGWQIDVAVHEVAHTGVCIGVIDLAVDGVGHKV